MHELSIALDLLDIAMQAAAERDATVHCVHVRIGELSGVVSEALASAWEFARVGSPLESAELQLEVVGSAAYCPACASEQRIVSPQWLRCARCGAAVGEITRGRELELVALEIDA